MDRHDFWRIANAMLRYYMHIADPDSLSDEEWCARYKELEWIRKEEAEVSREGQKPL